MNETVSEEEFLLSFEELILYFSKNPIQNTRSSINSPKDLFDQLSSNSNGVKLTILETSASTETNNISDEKLTKRFSNFIQLIEKTEFHNGLIPYDKITECVFENTPQEILYSFTNDLREHGNNYFSNLNIENDEDLRNKKAFYKIVRHIDLALIQKHSFANLKLGDMEELKQKNEELKRKNEELNQLYADLKKDAENQYKNMLTQYISILGIFAAILMGAFGAIQGFTSLFSNADKLSLGKIYIISSIGAAAVLLILFLLLNSIAKLTGRSLSSSKKENANFIEKHPTLAIVFGILILTSLIGASIELSNINLQLAWQGLWWVLPLFWAVYLIEAVRRGKPLFFIKERKVDNSKVNESP